MYLLVWMISSADRSRFFLSSSTLLYSSVLISLPSWYLPASISLMFLSLVLFFRSLYNKSYFSRSSLLIFCSFLSSLKTLSSSAVRYLFSANFSSIPLYIISFESTFFLQDSHLELEAEINPVDGPSLLPQEIHFLALRYIYNTPIEALTRIYYST